MYELIMVKGNSGYIDMPSKAGVYIFDDKSCLLIDTGNDKDAAKKILKTLEQHDLTVRFVINTHSHADHIGGNSLIATKTGCKIYSSREESAVASNTIWEPTYVFGGYPPKELCNKFIMAPISDVSPIEHLEIPKGFEIVPLLGHSMAMIGIKTPDNVFYIGDTLISETTLTKYKIPFIVDVEQHYLTLEMLKTQDSEFFVGSHIEALSDVKNLCDINTQHLKEIEKVVLEIIKTKKTFDQLLAEVFTKYDIKMDINQRFLIGFSIKSFLSYFSRNKKAEFEFSDNLMYWKSTESEQNDG